MEQNNHLKPTKFSALGELIILIISNIFIAIFMCIGKNVSEVEVVLYVLFALFLDAVILFFILRDYKEFYLRDAGILIKYYYLSFLSPFQIRFEDVSRFVVYKYSYQFRTSPLFKVHFKNGTSRRIFFRGYDMIPEFQQFFNEMRLGGAQLETEGDVWFTPPLEKLNHKKDTVNSQ